MRLIRRIVIILLILFGITTIVSLAKMEWVFSHMLTSRFKTAVTIQNVTFSPIKKITIENVAVKNPPPYESPYALNVGSILVVAPYLNYLNTVTIIDSILITDITLTVDYIKNITNWETLMDSLDTNSSNSFGGENPNSYCIIKDLTFKNLKVTVLKNGSTQNYTIDSLTLKNVKTKEGELTKRLTQAILSELIFNIQNIIMIPLKMTQDLFNAPVDSTFDGIKSLNPFGK